ncbi:MAG: hypothetical protein O3A82_01415 [Verrucomicrobia bacterium]|nr:hypothetical protein [Verrucomicrobiota bacterium]MDA1045567.1 hypothetical protein [Verrucomicrobiota bacterium]
MRTLVLHGAATTYLRLALSKKGHQNKPLTVNGKVGGRQATAARENTPKVNAERDNNLEKTTQPGQTTLE